MNIIFF